MLAHSGEKFDKSQVFLCILVFNDLLVYKHIYRYAMKNNSLDKIRVQLGAQIEFG